MDRADVYKLIALHPDRMRIIESLSLAMHGRPLLGETQLVSSYVAATCLLHELPNRRAGEAALEICEIMMDALWEGIHPDDLPLVRYIVQCVSDVYEDLGFDAVRPCPPKKSPPRETMAFDHDGDEGVCASASAPVCVQASEGLHHLPAPFVFDSASTWAAWYRMVHPHVDRVVIPPCFVDAREIEVVTLDIKAIEAAAWVREMAERDERSRSQHWLCPACFGGTRDGYLRSCGECGGTGEVWP